METRADHESDFIGWTETQAKILRSVPAGTFGLDTQNLAEEIADLGRSEIRETSSLLRQLLLHLIKLAADPGATAAAHWLDESLAFQGDAVLACSPGIRQRIDLPAIWRLAGNGAVRALAQNGVTIESLPPECPLTLDDLLETGFDPAAAVTAIQAAMTSGADAR